LGERGGKFRRRKEEGADGKEGLGKYYASGVVKRKEPLNRETKGKKPLFVLTKICRKEKEELIKAQKSGGAFPGQERREKEAPDSELSTLEGERKTPFSNPQLRGRKCLLSFWPQREKGGTVMGKEKKETPECPAKGG